MDTNARVLGYDKKLGSVKRCRFFFQVQVVYLFCGALATSRHGYRTRPCSPFCTRGICKGITKERRAILQGQGTKEDECMKSNNQPPWVIHLILLVMILWYVCMHAVYSVYHDIITTYNYSMIMYLYYISLYYSTVYYPQIDICWWRGEWIRP